jgi:hypothetical protein
MLIELVFAALIATAMPAQQPWAGIPNVTLINGEEDHLPTPQQLEGLLQAREAGKPMRLASGYIAYFKGKDDLIIFSPLVPELQRMDEAEGAIRAIKGLPSLGVHHFSEFGQPLQTLAASFIGHALPYYSQDPLSPKTALIFFPGCSFTLSDGTRTVNVDLGPSVEQGFTKKESEQMYADLDAAPVRIAPESMRPSIVDASKSRYEKLAGERGVNVRVLASPNGYRSNDTGSYLKGLTALRDYVDKRRDEINALTEQLREGLQGRDPRAFQAFPKGSPVSGLSADLKENLKAVLTSRRADYDMADEADVNDFMARATIQSERVSLTFLVALEPNDLMRIRIWP